MDATENPKWGIGTLKRAHRRDIYEVGGKGEIHEVSKKNLPKVNNQSGLYVCWQTDKFSQE